MKPCVQVYCLLAAGVFLCGCETVGAFGTGRVTKADVSYITHAGTLGAGAAPVDVNSLDLEQDYNVSAGRPVSTSHKVAKADAWLEENLW
jgi:hypothetical protein